MTALVIWGGDDHRVRAEALATAYATTAQNVTKKPSKVSHLKNLVFWGHGDAKDFCHLSADAFVALVTTWKKLNSGLESVEILTCNARHKCGGFTDSYTGQVVTKLTAKLADIQFKALPIATTKKGDTCNYSILKWHPGSASWAYIGAPTYTLGSGSQMDLTMHGAAELLAELLAPRGPHIGYPRALAALVASKDLTTTDPLAIRRKWGKAEVDKYNKDKKMYLENSFIMAGTVGTLRWCLSDIKG
jgi:hypothetical protein